MIASPRRRRAAYAVTTLLCGALVAPAAALASTGGSGLTPGSAPLGGPTTGTTSTPTTGSGDVPVSVAGDGVTLRTTASAMLRRGLSFSGTAAAIAGRTIEIERSGHETHWQWTPTVRATVGSGGSFDAVWHTNHIGRFAMRAVIVPAGQAQPSAARSATSTPALTITVYRPSTATLYGPGFYGRRTACGARLTRATIGLANRTLRCGESVALYYHGRTLRVPVIDRGPYANGADWDLTVATARALGITGTEQIGAVSLPRPPSAHARRG